MSQKWVRAKEWDDEHLRGVLLPLKVLLRLFSSVYFGVSLLVLVALYGILASVPIGLIALAPTWALYVLTLVATVAVCASVPVWGLMRVAGSASERRGARFAGSLIGGLLFAGGGVTLWYTLAWPHLRYDAATGSGVRFFGSFVDAYQTLQFRRLPMMEMSELEFYAWWPLRLILILFVVNMVVATLRRIEFSLPYLGVITVHTGIVTIALGSAYYASHKQEGDMLLMAGGLGEDGKPLPGEPESGFYDNTRTVLWVRQPDLAGATSAAGPRWDQRLLDNVPRYHEYNLNVLGLKSLPPMVTAMKSKDLGPIDVNVGPGAWGSGGITVVDPDVSFRVVGYAPYAELSSMMVRAGEVGAAANASTGGTAVRTIEAYLNLPADPSDPAAGDPARPRTTWRLMPDSPARRVDILSVQDQALLGVEYTRGMKESRWKDLSVSLPRGTRHALVVRHPASGFEGVFPVERGSRVQVGQTGYTLEVDELSPEPPFPIVTRGYEGGRSSVAIVHVQPPPPAAGETGQPAYQRWIYHRYPEISQDLVDSPASQGGTPMGGGGRRNADPALDIAYIDASIIQIYFDETAPGESGGQGDSPVRAMVRLPGGGVTVTPDIGAGESARAVEVAPGFTLRLAERIDDAVRVEIPVPVPESQRDPKLIGAHQRAAVAVEVSAMVKGTPWRTVLWVPFSQYLDPSGQGARRVAFPDGRSVLIAFGRERHEFWPPMMLRLADFEMIPYDHAPTLPRDFRSDLVVMRRWGTRHEDVIRRTSLNEPLLERTPFQPRSDVAGPINAIGWLFSQVAPNQYKFSQAGWDQEGWMQSLDAVQRGELARPFARYTILGVGNNPGIYIIAAGAVMMSLGIPWAFYVKPLIVRRRKRKIQAMLAAGTYVKPSRGRGTEDGNSNGTGPSPHPSATSDESTSAGAHP